MWKLNRCRAPRTVPATPHEDVMRGGMIGIAAGALFATLLGASGGLLAFGAALGLFTGFVTGLLVWLSTAEFPDAPIPPVIGPARQSRREQRRPR